MDIHYRKYWNISTNLTTWSRVLLEKLIITELVKKSQSFWNPKVYYFVHKSLTLVPMLSKILRHVERLNIYRTTNRQ